LPQVRADEVPISDVDLNKQEKLTMETALLIQAASSIAGAMAATQYGKFGGMEASKLLEVATISVKIARAIEAEVLKQP
jgi:hypothetical protein